MDPMAHKCPVSQNLTKLNVNVLLRKNALDFCIDFKCLKHRQKTLLTNVNRITYGWNIFNH